MSKNFHDRAKPIIPPNYSYRWYFAKVSVLELSTMVF